MTFFVDNLILVGAVLLLAGVVSSKFSSRFGLPVLILFLGVGMLAGENGIGGIAFDDYQLAHAIGTLALALILFDGGLRTELSSIRGAGVPAGLLATIGVLLTALLTGGATHLLIGLPLLESLLLGSIVASTDAAAVFSLLRTGGLQLRSRLAATLEIESGSNDPMAILLTLMLIQAILGDLSGGGGIALFLVLQIGCGIGTGVAVGWAASVLINRIQLEAAGLYPVLVAVCGLLAYGVAPTIGGNGFLSVYVAGIVLGNRRIVFRRSTLLLHDGLAWIAQMVMFIMMGLLSTPADLLVVATDGLLIALVLMLVARPIAVFFSLLPFSYPKEEVAFLSWAGLKGAVPIILATYPLMFGVPNARLIFDIVFFVVLVSATTQGWSLIPLANLLGVKGPARPTPPIALELTSLRNVDGDIVDYTVTEDSRVAGRRLRDIALAEGAVVALITRGEQVIPPRGSSELLVGDHVFVVMRPGSRAPVDAIFCQRAASEPVGRVEFPLTGHASVADLRDFYGIAIDAEDEVTLNDLVCSHIGHAPGVDDEITLGGVRLRVLEVSDDRIESIGLSVPGIVGAGAPESPRWSAQFPPK